MKTLSTLAFVLILAFAIASQGFQCGSPEFSGAKVRIQQKDFAGAIRLLKEEVKKNPTNEEAWFLLGELDADQGDYAGMNEAFNETAKLTNKHDKDMYNMRFSKWGVHINDGVTFLNRASQDSTQLYDSAIVYFNTAQLIWPDTALTYKYLAIAYNNKGDFDNALVSFKESWEKAKDLESLKRVARIYFQKGSELDTKFETDNADSLHLLSNLKKIKVGSHQNDVIAAFGAPDDRKNAAPPKKGKKGGTKEPPKEVWTYKNIGLRVVIANTLVDEVNKPLMPRIDSTMHFKALGMYDSAAKYSEQAKVLDPKDQDNLNLLLQAYVKSGKITEAISTFTIAEQNDPGNKNTHYILGILYRESGEYQTAIDEFKKALEIDPNFTDAEYDCGATLFNWGVNMIRQEEEKNQGKLDPNAPENPAYKEKFKAALPYLEKVSEVKKDDPQIFETLGKIYLRIAQSEKGKKVFEVADWLRKHPGLKLGMKEADLRAVLGEPASKTDTTFDNAPASSWVYDKDGVTIIVADGAVRDWTLTGK